MILSGFIKTTTMLDIPRDAIQARYLKHRSVHTAGYPRRNRKSRLILHGGFLPILGAIARVAVPAIASLFSGKGFFGDLLKGVAKAALKGAAKGALSSAGSAAKDSLLAKGKELLKGKGTTVTRRRRVQPPVPLDGAPPPGPDVLQLSKQEDSVARQELIESLRAPVHSSFVRAPKRPPRKRNPDDAKSPKRAAKQRRDAKRLAEALDEGESAGAGLYRAGGRGLARAGMGRGLYR